jgi:drug/metabolite transporter (DMT)-like permease
MKLMPPRRFDTTTGRASRLGSVVVALGTVYLVWGSTYFGILIAIKTIPPLSMAALRFTVAGGLLYAWAVRRGDREGDRPGLAQWAAAAVVGSALLAAGNGAVTWAEQRIPSGIAALLIASVPLWMSLLGRVLLGERLSWMAVLGLAVGFAGLVLLVRPSGTDRLDLVATVVVLGGALAWAGGSVWSRRAPLPRRPLVTTGMEMLAGGAVLAVASVVIGEDLGEGRAGDLGEGQASLLAAWPVLPVKLPSLFGPIQVNRNVPRGQPNRVANSLASRCASRLALGRLPRWAAARGCCPVAMAGCALLRTSTYTRTVAVAVPGRGRVE